MPNYKIKQYTDDDLREAYASSGTIEGMAALLNISYATASKWANEYGIDIKKQGYTPPKLDFTGLQCRHAREALGLTRDQVCELAGISKMSLMNFELRKSIMRLTTFIKLKTFFDKSGVTFHCDGTFSFTRKQG